MGNGQSVSDLDEGLDNNNNKQPKGEPQTFTEWMLHNPDAEYFQYGKHQRAEAIRTRYFSTGLLISDPRYIDGEFYMLNPKVVTKEGEWEAWFYGSWLPGAHRYHSFWEMMQAEYERFLKIRDI